jgi:hypothetical protein
MGYAHYEITRPDGITIEAGYGVEAVCEEEGCKAKIDRGLGYLCGKDPGGDEHGCGGYFCGEHLTGGQQCSRCAEAADKANGWVHPESGEEFDLRDQFLPAGTPYDAHGTVWQYAGFERDGSPVLEPFFASGEGAEGSYRLLTEGEWENAAVVMYRQMQEKASA